jgi:hypothetical protein
VNRHTLVLWVVWAVILTALAACQPVVMPASTVVVPAANASGPVLPTDPVEVQIANALSAAPLAVAQDAAIVGYPTAEGGDMVPLRAGLNDWTCYPDWPATPGNDPMCLDPVWQAWFAAYVTGAEPETTILGIAYMLAGGSEASATDPTALAPAAGEEWLVSPPHLMLLMPGGFDPADFPGGHHSGEPWIMWEGTPYEHLMVPVVAAAEPTGPVATAASAEAKIRNIMGAVPQVIGDGATLMDWPAEAGGEMALLRSGTNAWMCVPDWPATPDNDPMCFDPTYTAWMGAFMMGHAPEISALGVSYMLSGGAMASSTDPFAMEPAAGDAWVRPGPHVMLVAPGGFDAADFGVDYASGKPWIAWDETPYEFLIIPVE